jgi:hypothetical protein
MRVESQLQFGLVVALLAGGGLEAALHERPCPMMPLSVRNDVARSMSAS